MSCCDGWSGYGEDGVHSREAADKTESRRFENLRAGKKREIRQGAKRETMKAIRGRGGGSGVQNETEQSDIDERGN